MGYTNGYDSGWDDALDKLPLTDPRVQKLIREHAAPITPDNPEVKAIVDAAVASIMSGPVLLAGGVAELAHDLTVESVRLPLVTSVENGAFDAFGSVNSAALDSYVVQDDGHGLEDTANELCLAWGLKVGCHVKMSNVSVTVHRSTRKATATLHPTAVAARAGEDPLTEINRGTGGFYLHSDGHAFAEGERLTFTLDSPGLDEPDVRERTVTTVDGVPHVDNPFADPIHASLTGLVTYGNDAVGGEVAFVPEM